MSNQSYHHAFIPDPYFKPTMTAIRLIHRGYHVSQAVETSILFHTDKTKPDRIPKSQLKPQKLFRHVIRWLETD